MSNLILSKCSRSILIHPSSTLSINPDAKYYLKFRQEKLRINTFTLQRTCVFVYETLMSQASAASGRGEGGARPSPHSKIFVFKSLQSWGGPLQTAQTARSFSNVFALFLTSLRNVIIIIINILAQFSILHRKKRGSKQRFRYEYFDIVMFLI